MLKRLLYSICGTIVLLTGCQSGNSHRKGTTSDQTFIIYAMADNNLWSYLSRNVEAAKRYVATGLPENARILIYWDGQREYFGEKLTMLTELVCEDGQAVEYILKKYDDQNSADPAVMRQVLSDAQSFAPAESYGISLLAHGTGWFPPELVDLRQPVSGSTHMEHDLRRPEEALTRAYGPDGTEYMSVEDLAQGLQQIDFDYVIFDLCFMSSIEALYALRDVAPYIMASPTEVMGAGIPYDRMLPIILNTGLSVRDRLAKAAEDIVAYYDVQTYPSAAFTVIDTKWLPKVADAVKAIFEGDTTVPDLEAIQELEILQEHAFFDLTSYLRNITEDSSDAARMAFADFEATLAETVIYQKHTPQIYSALGTGGGAYFDATDMCGVSSYIPRDWLPVTRAAYYATEWGQYTQPQQ